MKRYPRSFLQLVTFGYIVVVIPFLLVTAYVFVTLKTLDRRYQVAIEEVSETSRLSSEITEDLIHLERSLRRYEVLKDADLLNDYTSVRAEWQGNVQAFSRLSVIPEQMTRELQAEIQLENAAYLSMLSTKNTGPLRSTIEEIRARLHKQIDGVQVILDREQSEFKEQANGLRERVLYAMAAAAVFALFCILQSRYLLARLIRRFENAVLGLGKGNLTQAIALDGPNDLRWLGRWLEWLRRRLLSLEESRTLVLRHISHELKTPLAAMREGSNLLAEEVPGPLTKEQARIVSILQGNTQRLQDLIEGLLRLQQAGHATERIDFQTLRFDQLTEQVLETYRLIAAERSVAFHVVLTEVEIVAGREALLTIVDNLLSNAVKFSPEGGTIRIELSLHGKLAWLDVCDEGPGVHEKDKKWIFDPFYRGLASPSTAGVGLGLAIAREFVLAHRGELMLLSAQSCGAHFRVILPLDATFVRLPRHV